MKKFNIDIHFFKLKTQSKSENQGFAFNAAKDPPSLKSGILFNN